MWDRQYFVEYSDIEYEYGNIPRSIVNPIEHCYEFE